jgi:hypothetical protein
MPGESAKSYAAFRRFRDRGAERTLVGCRSVERRWSWKHSWRERAEAWDDEVARRHDEALLGGQLPPVLDEPPPVIPARRRRQRTSTKPWELTMDEALVRAAPCEDQAENCSNSVEEETPSSEQPARLPQPRVAATPELDALAAELLGGDPWASVVRALEEPRTDHTRYERRGPRPALWEPREPSAPVSRPCVRSISRLRGRTREDAAEVHAASPGPAHRVAGLPAAREAHPGRARRAVQDAQSEARPRAPRSC